MSRSTIGSLGYLDEFQTREDSAPHGESSAPDAAPGIRRFWGKHRGVVMNPVDPEMRCRLLVSVTDVWGPNVSSWALPCLPYAGLSLGMYILPPVGANVWVEFLNGHPDYPVWCGFWFGSTATAPKTPALGAPGLPQFTLESFTKHAMVVSDTPLIGVLPKGGILLKSGASYIAIEPSGIRIFGLPGGVQVNGSPGGDPASAGLFVL